MKMTPALLVVGGLLVFWASVFVIVILPAVTMDETPSAAWRPWTPLEEEGHRLYVANGCSYCHSQFVRTIDWGEGAERIAERGDYHGRNPAILGTERTGPDLSQEGGEHPDDWHVAHFANPRHTRPLSLMPSWEFLGPEKTAALTAFVQASSGTDADYRVRRQLHWKDLAVKAYRLGPDKNAEWLHAQVPEVWRMMPNPYPATDVDLARGEKIYQDFCTGCHGSVGDGKGPAAARLDPAPMNFPTLARHLGGGKYIGGLLYYQIMNGVTGTAMPYFKRELESEKIWDVSNYIAVRFITYTDATLPPHGIDAAYQPPWENTYKPTESRGSGGL
jgi:cytochrome c oxidase cbb3-type subunit II